MYNPPTTINPKNISSGFILLLKKKGSINEVNNAPVLIITNAIETLETLIALKKKIQCSAIIIPERKNFNNVFLSNRNDFFLMTKYKAIKIDANSILYQTKGIASIEINAPKMAVNPQMNTIRCKCR